MIDCPNGEVRDQLPDYLHDRLESSARASVERHLAGCAACREELVLLRDLRGTLRHAPRIDVAAVAAAIPPYRTATRRSSGSGWRIAAAIVAIAVGGTSIALIGHARDRVQVARNPVAAPGAHAPATETAPAASAPQVAALSQPTPTTTATAAPAKTSVKAVPPVREQELAMGGGTIADLSDGELSDLIGDLESLDALPSTDVEATESLLTGRQRGRHD